MSRYFMVILAICCIQAGFVLSHIALFFDGAISELSWLSFALFFYSIVLVVSHYRADKKDRKNKFDVEISGRIEEISKSLKVSSEEIFDIQKSLEERIRFAKKPRRKGKSRRSYS